MLASKHVEYKMTMRYSRTEALQIFGAMGSELLFTTNYLFSCVHMAEKNDAYLTLIVTSF